MGDSYRVDGSHNGDYWYCPSYQEHASILKLQSNREFIRVDCRYIKGTLNRHLWCTLN
jgi:hypothetical protein